MVLHRAEEGVKIFSLVCAAHIHRPVGPFERSKLLSRLTRELQSKLFHMVVLSVDLNRELANKIKHEHRMIGQMCKLINTPLEQ